MPPVRPHYGTATKVFLEVVFVPGEHLSDIERRPLRLRLQLRIGGGLDAVVERADILAGIAAEHPIAHLGR